MDGLGIGLSVVIVSILTFIGMVLLIREFKAHKKTSNEYKEKTVAKLTKLENNQKWTIDTMKLNFNTVAKDLNTIDNRVDSIQDRIERETKDKTASLLDEIMSGKYDKKYK